MTSSCLINEENIDILNRLEYFRQTGEWPERRTDIPVCLSSSTQPQKKEATNAPR